MFHDPIPAEPTIQHLLDTIVAYYPEADLDLVKRAYELAAKSHQNQKRLTGEDFIFHPLRVGLFLAQKQLDIPTIVAGLLHDSLEDTAITLNDIEKLFGHEIAVLVQGVTELDKLKYRGLDRYVENLRKMFVAVANDVRIILIKFADRLHNLETLHGHPKHKQERIAKETLEIYAPIASRLSMGEMKGLLEDLAFPYALPKEYAKTKKIIGEEYPKKEQLVKELEVIIKRELDRAGLKYKSIHGRAKHIYSLYQKLETKDWDISEVHDLMALRIVVENIGDCYTTLGILHQRFKPLKGRIKDYIANPKPNGYQSLHTTVFTLKGEMTELQIRTPAMHAKAEWGVAAHWHYDEYGHAIPGKRYQWVQEINKKLISLKDNTQFLESLKLDIFQNRIFVFTPKGEVIDLPESSTPVDFAYHIHTDIGNRCAGALVNNEIASLDTPLQNGDVVKIIIDKNKKGPNPDWLKFVKTNTARSRIRGLTKKSIFRWMKNVIPKKGA